MSRYLNVLLWMAIVLLSLPYVTNNVIKPCGLKLCKERCDSLSYCSPPVYDFNILTCVLWNTNTTDTKMIERYRRLRSRAGRRVKVSVGFKKVYTKNLKNKTNGNVVTKTNKVRMVRDRYIIRGGDGFSFKIKHYITIPGICSTRPPKYYYRRGRRMMFGRFRLRGVTAIWVNTNEERCPQSKPKEIIDRVAKVQERYEKVPLYARTPGKDFIIWALTGKEPNKDCRDSFKEAKYHHYEY